MKITVKKYIKNPILLPRLNEFPLEFAVYNPAVIEKDGKVFMFYRSEVGYDYISRINLAESVDGFSFREYSNNPVVKPENDDEKMGCEDPRVIKTDDGKYFMTYTAYMGRDERGDYRFSLYGAFSSDLVSWEKFKIKDKVKSGAVIKVKEKYIMYVGGETIRVATSTNLRDWKFEDTEVLAPREGDYFDNYLTESGSGALLDGKILLIYNAKDKNRRFCAGYALFDANEPGKLLERAEKALLKPEKYWEKYGKINNAVFATSLIKFKDKWLLYYGGSDKAVGVAELKIE